MTHLRKIMLEELERRNYSQSTVRTYIRTVEDFAQDFKRPPDQAGLPGLRRLAMSAADDCRLIWPTLIPQPFRLSTGRTEVGQQHSTTSPYFNLLQNAATSTQPIFFYAFDLPGG